MTGWTALVPIKTWSLAKSRMKLSIEMRSALAESFARDVLEAVAASRRVDAILVISAEPGVRSVARRHGAAVLEDRPMIAPDSLNDAVAKGASWAQARRHSEAVIVVPADLPAITTAHLDEALHVLQRKFRDHDMAFVPDASGAGTTLLAARRPEFLHSHYGYASAVRHQQLGAAVVAGVNDRVRRDVDTLDDLEIAHHLGLGQHAAAVWNRSTVAAGER